MKEKNYASIRNLILSSMLFAPLLPFVMVLGIGYFYFMTSLENRPTRSRT